jgi:hypothetical protein
MTTQIQSARSQNEQRAIKLLGSGCTIAQTALAVGVTESRISQLMADENFAQEVATLKFQALNKHNEMDDQYDGMEKKLAKAFEEQMPMLMRPMEILKAMQVINSLKRRGQSSPEQVHNQNTVVTLVMPTQIVHQFTTNVNNQVIKAGVQTLETIQSGALLAETKQQLESLHHELPTYTKTELIAGN